MDSFNSLSSISALKEYLSDKAKRLNNTNSNKELYVYHYTSVNAVNSILKDKYWYIGSPKKMNDGLELNSFNNDSVWNNIFFSSFMNDVGESIAMWSMYAQPWEAGMIIKIPIRTFKTFANSDLEVYSADQNTKKPLKKITDKAIISINAVAYSTVDENGNNVSLTCGKETNDIIKNVSGSVDILGFIKNSAWEYEKELRLRVDVDSSIIYDAVALKLTDDLIDSMRFIAGPRYDSTLNPTIAATTDSLFKGNLKWIYCDECRTV